MRVLVRSNDPVRLSFLTVLLARPTARRSISICSFRIFPAWVSATCETMTLHVDMTTKKVAPWPTPVVDALARLQNAHAPLPKPDGAGRAVSMAKKS